MRIVEIPILGRPQAGKTTVLHRARDAFGGQLHSLEYPLGARLAALHIQTEEAHGHLWCLPGNSSPESIVPLLPAGSPAVFVFDGEEREWLEVLSPHVDLSRSVVIVTKADLSADPAAAIPSALRDRPFIHIAARDPHCAPHLHRLLSEHFRVFERPEGARPLQERVALASMRNRSPQS
jgi:hypothetical protein